MKKNSNYFWKRFHIDILSALLAIHAVDTNTKGLLFGDLMVSFLDNPYKL